MSRATTKKTLIDAANSQFNTMWALINTMSAKEQQALFDFDNLRGLKEAHWKRDKNLRDVLIHLYEWHQLLLNWVNANQQGKAQPFLLAPYNWKTYQQMNVVFWQKHQTTSYAQAIKILNESHANVMVLIDSYSNDELFTNKHFSWIGNSSLGSYCVSATASHYGWAIKKIKKQMMVLKKN